MDFMNISSADDYRTRKYFLLCADHGGVAQQAAPLQAGR
jgi:hypothetical protein